MKESLLSEWIYRNRLNKTEAAKVLKISKQLLNYWLKLQRVPQIRIKEVALITKINLRALVHENGERRI